MSQPVPKPTEAELELLRVLWEKEPATVREVCDELNRGRAYGYTTVLKLLQIMHAKGLVEREEAGRAHVYRAAESQDAMQSKLLRDLSTRLFAGSAAQLAMHALAMEPASSAELDEIRELLERKRAGQGAVDPRGQGLPAEGSGARSSARQASQVQGAPVGGFSGPAVATPGASDRSSFKKDSTTAQSLPGSGLPQPSTRKDRQ